MSNALLLISRQRLKREKKDESKNEEKITLYNIDEESSWNIESESFAEEVSFKKYIIQKINVYLVQFKPEL